MICVNCGKYVEDGAVFCTNCGTRVSAPVITVSEQETANAVSEPAAEAKPAQPYTAPYAEPVASSWSNQPQIQPVVPDAPQKEKVYFGKGALAFCLVVIGLLAISTGVFAGLYFSVI